MLINAYPSEQGVRVYWLISILVIIAMIGTLAVAESMTLPVSPLLTTTASVSIELSLLTAAIILGLLAQRNILSSAASDKFFPKVKPTISILPKTTFRYLIIIVLASFLIIASALQALSSHQQAKASSITETMRVQAWVTIEGISDSVYDPVMDSGYRQVATLRAITPLVSEVTTKELQSATTDYINGNRLDNGAVDNAASGINSSQSSQYRVLLNAYPKGNSKGQDSNNLASLNHLQPGDQLLMTLTLAPLATSQQAINNPSGFDSYRWLRGRHIDGIANVIVVGTPVSLSDTSTLMAMANSDSYLKRIRTAIDQWRWQLRQHFYQDWQAQSAAEQQAKAVTLSLLTGDRSLINRETKDLYQLAGISHLLAISGTHVLFLAIMLAGMAVLLVDRMRPALYRILPRWQLRWWVMISAAFIYALFTGFDVPAARTAWMLLAIGLVRLTLLPISTMRVLLALAVLMAWFDPYVLWQAGYWLSFIAVALLLKYDETLQQQAIKQKQAIKLPPLNNTDQFTINRVHWQLRARMWLPFWLLIKRVFKLQFWLFVALLPITLLLFGKASLWGLVINLFAIGLFGWVIVPLNLLAGLCYLVSPLLADKIWTLVSTIVSSLHELITWLTSLPALSGAWLYTPVNMAILLITLLAMLPWLLPRGLLSRWLVLPPLTLLMMTVYANQQVISTTPTLYVLPTGDTYLSAAVLQYPIDDSKASNNNKNSSAKGNSSWLFLADNRSSNGRTMPSALTAEKLSASLEQQLRTLSIKHLEGIVVQTGVPALTDTLPSNLNSLSKNSKSKTELSMLLPKTVMQLSQVLPINQYWQAGRSERWSILKGIETSSKPKTLISAQDCTQGKTWQLANSDLTLQVLTGWSEVDDSSIWDCTVAIDSRQPIQVVQYQAANPRQSVGMVAQKLTQVLPIIEKSTSKTATPIEIQQNEYPISRIILDAATHQRSWQLWSLLCTAKPFAINIDANGATTWLGHSNSQIFTEVISQQRVDEVITYDDKSLEAALALNAAF